LKHFFVIKIKYITWQKITKIYLHIMKKLFLIAVAILFVGSSFASSTTSSSYIADDNQIEQLFASSEEVSLSSSNEATALLSKVNSITADETTKTGFLVRAFFCGGFALHRSYMGTKGMFIKYFCTLGIVGTIDFCIVLIKGDEAFSKFKGNDKFWVWGKK
jgi:hypothetical protein